MVAPAALEIDRTWDAYTNNPLGLTDYLAIDKFLVMGFCIGGRDFVRACQTPILVLPDDYPRSPYAVAMECALLAPKPK